jgi:hypothetical protein
LFFLEVLLLAEGARTGLTLHGRDEEDCVIEGVVLNQAPNLATGNNTAKSDN